MNKRIDPRSPGKTAGMVVRRRARTREHGVGEEHPVAVFVTELPNIYAQDTPKISCRRNLLG